LWGNRQIPDFRLSAFPQLVLCIKYDRNVQVIFAKEFSYNVEGRAMAQALNPWTVIAEARVLFPAAPRVVCGGQSGTGQVFLRVLLYSHLSFIQSITHTVRFT
jgi:hypothetical protein